MKTNIYTRNGKVSFDTDNCREIFLPGNPIHTAVESCFEDWINEQPPETVDMYTLPLEEYRGDTFYDMSGAIEGGINNLVEYIKENNIKSTTTRVFYKAEVQTAFEPE